MADAPPEPLSTADRIRQRKEAESAAKPAKARRKLPLWHELLVGARGWADTIVFAYMLAMLIRTFGFELFMIPTGSMTPTLIGDQDRRVAFVDYDGDGARDVVSVTNNPSELLVFLLDGDGKLRQLLTLENLPFGFTREIVNSSPGQTDMILVNKFAYWFSEPERGDIAVFKVPDREPPADYPDRRNPFDPYKPIYIKRVVGLPDEQLALMPVKETLVPHGTPEFRCRLRGVDARVRERHFQGVPLFVNGKPLDADSILSRIPHFPAIAGTPRAGQLPQALSTGPGEVLMLGDNQSSSSDSRFWGPVPTTHLRGRAVLRYWPWRDAGFFGGDD
ncbi:MAG: S26 family signal peptidase [Candidatus Sumerlaeia bacterium]|nr:S26 family signal peptidase [Candidatus Sumerlaeia bacterium]